MPFLGILFTLGRGLLGGLMKYWKIILPVVAVAIALWYVHHLQSEVQKYKSLYEQDTLVIKDWSDKFTALDNEYKLQVETCKKTIADQNAHVEAVAKQAEKFKNQAAVAKQQSETIRKQYEKRIETILNEPKPKDCPDSIRYLIEHAKELGTWEEDKEEGDTNE